MFFYLDVKLNANTQSILEKILEEQLKQRTTIEALQESNMELKHEILENRKLLQNILAILTVGKTKQWLKRNICGGM